MRILPGLFPAGTEDVRAWRCFVWRVFWHEGGALCHQIWAPVPLFWHPWRLQPTSTSSSLLGLLLQHLNISPIFLTPMTTTPTPKSPPDQDSPHLLLTPMMTLPHLHLTHLRVKPMQFFSRKDPKSNDWVWETGPSPNMYMAWQRREEVASARWKHFFQTFIVYALKMHQSYEMRRW